MIALIIESKRSNDYEVLRLCGRLDFVRAVRRVYGADRGHSESVSYQAAAEGSQRHGIRVSMTEPSDLRRCRRA